MIQKVEFLHYLSEDAYKKICRKFRLNDSDRRTKDNFVLFPGEKITKISMFNILYEQFGHIWFMAVEADFPKFVCPYEAFDKALYEHYQTIFGAEIMGDFPSYDQLNCGYVEYSSFLKTDRAVSILNTLAEKCPPEQLDKALWKNYKKPHGTIEFCLAANEDGIEALARCHGTALKKESRILHFTAHQVLRLVRL